MDAYQVMLPAKIVIGPGSLSCLGDEAGKLGVKRALIVTDPGVYRAGLTEPVKEQLTRQKISVDIYSGAEPEPTLHWLNAAVAKLGNPGYQLIVGVGGGSSIDIAKAISVLLSHGGKGEDYIGVDKIPGPIIPIFALPTTAGTGSEATKNAVFNDEAKGYKSTIVSPLILPHLALVDAELTYTCPPEITAASGIDALVHAIESYVSNKANCFTDAISLKAMQLVADNLKVVVRNGADSEARNRMAEGALFAGIAFANSGLGAVHGVAQLLGARFHVPHGVANGLFLPYVMACNLPADLPKYAVVARVMGVDTAGLSLAEAAEKGVEKVTALAEDIGIPTHLREVGVPEAAIGDMALANMEFERPMCFNPKKLVLDDVRTIWQNAW